MINEFFKYTSDPLALYDWIELLSSMFDCNGLILRRATEIAVLNEYQYRPHPMEYTMLLVMSGQGVRQVCRDQQVSTSTYYSYKRKVDDGIMNVSPKYPEGYRADIIKCMRGLQKLITIVD